MRKLSQELPLLLELEHDQHDIAKIKQQRQLITRVQATIAKKDQEIDSLKALIEKYQIYQQKYSSLKLELSEKTQLIARKDGEYRLIKRQLEQTVKDYEELTGRTKHLQHDNQQLVRERQAIERTNKDTERLFKEYQSECRRREQDLTQQLQRAYHKHKEQNAKIDDLQNQVESLSGLRTKISQLQKELEQKQNPKERTPLRPQLTQNDDLATEVMRLQEELLRKEEELTSQRMLNYELTLEYNQTVSSLCGLETELSSYRRENIELKQVLSLLRQQHHSLGLERKYRASGVAAKLRERASSEKASEEESEGESGAKIRQQLVSTQS